MFEGLNEKIKKLTVMDIGLVKGAVFFAAIIIAKIFPQLLNIPFLVLIILVIICSAKPVYEIWIKK